MARKAIRVGVDTGGTFTDLIVIDERGNLIRGKVLSTPDDFSRGIIAAIQTVIDEHDFEAADFSEIIHGTTVATNAVLEGNGPAIGMLTTRGFRDVLEIGRCRWDGDIFDLGWQKPPCLIHRHLRRELDERVDSRGEVLRALDPDQVRAEICWLRDHGARAIAVCLINAYANPVHERIIREIAASEAPELALCISTDVLGEIREFERASTTAINTYLVPVVEQYLSRLEHSLATLGSRANLQVMQSNGGIMSAAAARKRPVHIVESGPAAGVLACAYLARQTGEQNLIAFDMGGTTAKASLIEDGRWFEAFEYHVGGGMSQGSSGGTGGQVVRLPSIDIAEVGAGGGSIAFIDEGGLLKVGPRSAGSAPGPACYDLGGTEPTVTDAYAVLGYLNPQSIAGGSKRISLEHASSAIRERVAKHLSISIEEAAHSIYTVATANIIRAVRAVTVERGRDARDYALVAFGGAGPMHAAELARSMGLTRVIIPSCSGLFSALGLLMADIEHDYARTVLVALASVGAAELTKINEAFDELAIQARADLLAEDAPGEIRLARTVTLHYTGQSHELVLDAPGHSLTDTDLRELALQFQAEHRRVYGYAEPVSRVQLVSVRLKATCPTAKPSYRDIGSRLTSQDSRTAATVRRSRRAYFGPRHGWHDTPVYCREQVESGGRAGPAIIEEMDTTILIPPGTRFALDASGSIVLTVEDAAAASDESLLDNAEAATTVNEAAADLAAQPTVSAMSLELVNNALNSITDEMAIILTRTARSLGIKDARDFSIAICTAEGELVSGGVGLAIHLGAIPAALAAIRAKFAHGLVEGDVIFMNDPYSGGMHLPDIFVIKPLFIDSELLGWSAVVAHMADIGGRVPGGNAADSTSIYQEGLRIPPIKLYSGGVLQAAWLELVSANVRLGEVVVADIHAEVAACGAAETEFRQLAGRLGVAGLRAHMCGLIDYGERMARAALAKCPKGRYSFVDHVDDDGVGGEPVRIQATVDIDENRILVDLSGTASQVRGAINAPLAITQSTVNYVLQSLIGRDQPNNAGFSRIVELKVAPGTVANMVFPAACAARAVTAYRIMDALYGALAGAMPDKVPAAGDGGPTMIGVGGEDQQGESFVFIEVLSGAFGGRGSGDGLEGVACPFANTQNTSVEMIEAGAPLLVEAYEFVADTGGAGLHRGGLAVRRNVRFLGRRGILQVRSDRQLFAPWGLAGGEAGSTASTILYSANGATKPLAGKVVVDIETGDMWSYTTASGGGWGERTDRSPSAVVADVRAGKLSVARATALYPHVLNVLLESGD